MRIKYPWQMTFEEFMNLEPQSSLGDRSRTPKECMQIRENDSSLADYNAEMVAYFLDGDKRAIDFIERGRKITIYRTTDRNEKIIWPGSYVSSNLAYAEKHGELHLRKPKLVFTNAYASELFPASGPPEFFYVPQDLRAWHRQCVIDAVDRGERVPSRVWNSV